MCECGTLDFYNVRFKSNAFFRSLKYFYKQETLINIYFDSHTGQTEIRLQYTKKHLFFSFCLASLPVSKCNIITDSIIRHVSLSLSLSVAEIPRQFILPIKGEKKRFNELEKDY